MTQTKRLTARLHLPVLAARTWQEYLDAHEGDAERAGRAARADVAERERQNSAARRFVDAYRPLVQHLQLPESPEDAESVSSQALAAVKKLQADAGSSGDAAQRVTEYEAALRELGIDPAKLKDGITSAKAKFARAGDADKLEREAKFAQAAEKLGFDPKKLQHQLRDETGLPEERKVKVKVRGADGNETEQEQELWGLPVRDASGKETGFRPLTEHEGVKGFEAALKREGAAATPDVRLPTTPRFVPQPATPTGSAPTIKVDSAAVAVGAGSV